jgi:hypothetical protein
MLSFLCTILLSFYVIMFVIKFCNHFPTFTFPKNVTHSKPYLWIVKLKYNDVNINLNHTGGAVPLICTSVKVGSDSRAPLLRKPSAHPPTPSPQSNACP